MNGHVGNTYNKIVSGLAYDYSSTVNAHQKSDRAP